MTKEDKTKFNAFLKNYHQDVIVLNVTDDDIAAYKILMRRWLNRKQKHEKQAA